MDPTLREIERQVIESRMMVFECDKTLVAESLGISLKTLYTRLHSYDPGGDRWFGNKKPDKETILARMELYHGRKPMVAASLGITLKTLNDKLDRYKKCNPDVMRRIKDIERRNSECATPNT